MDERTVLEGAIGHLYCFERELEAGRSRVFVATEVALERKVAIKVPRGGARREIGHLAQLQHPNIVPLLGAGSVEGLSYFVTPFIEGETLRVKLASGPLPLDDCLRILTGLARALTHAHARGLVHRDIKPENILLSSGSAVLTDFGIATKPTRESREPVDAGTAAYLAPEQAVEGEGVDARADLYSLGVVAYEMVSGRHPFSHRDSESLLLAHAAEEPEPLDVWRPTVPPELSRLVSQLLEKLPADRPASAEMVLRHLEGVSTSMARPQRTRRRLLEMTSVVCVAVVVMASPRLIGERDRANVAAISPPSVVLQAGVAPVAAHASVNRRPPAGRRIAVVPFINATGDSTYGILANAIAYELADAISRLDSVAVVPVEMAQFDELGHRRRLTSLDSVRALAERAGASQVVWGRVTIGADSVRLTANVVDIASGDVSAVIGPAAASRRSPELTIALLRERVVTQVDGARLRDRAGSMGTPPNLPAYREFLLGLEERWRRTRDTIALRHFEAAAHLDSSFAIAYYYAGMTHVRIGLDAHAPDPRLKQARMADSVLRLMEARRAELAPVELDLADQLRAIVHADRAGAVVASRKLLARDSSAGPAVAYAEALMKAGRMREAMEFIHRWPADRLIAPFGEVAAMDVLAHHFLGRHDESLAEIDRWKRAFPRLNLRGPRMMALAASGKFALLRRVVDSAAAEYSWPEPKGAHLYVNVSRELLAHGWRDSARTYALEGIAAHRAHHDTATWTMGHLWLAAGELDSARAAFARSPTGGGWNGPLVNNATIAALLGDTAAAMDAIRRQEELAKDPLDYGFSRYGEARIYAALGRSDDAVRVLRDAVAAGLRLDYPGFHTDPIMALKLANYAPYRAMMRPR